ncbi:hypothetical protein AcV7_008970 [Taiwanofungus camphoratus]|nr:hypothetical protein AcV7_008970 [Antrodia cinnamomea]
MQAQAACSCRHVRSHPSLRREGRPAAPGACAEASRICLVGLLASGAGQGRYAAGACDAAALAAPQAAQCWMISSPDGGLVGRVVPSAVVIGVALV